MSKNEKDTTNQAGKDERKRGKLKPPDASSLDTFFIHEKENNASTGHWEKSGQIDYRRVRAFLRARAMHNSADWPLWKIYQNVVFNHGMDNNNLFTQPDGTFSPAEWKAFKDAGWLDKSIPSDWEWINDPKAVSVNYS